MWKKSNVFRETEIRFNQSLGSASLYPFEPLDLEQMFVSIGA